VELLIVNGWARTVYRPEDFEALIRENMGDDAADYFRRFYVQLGEKSAQERELVQADLDYMMEELEQDSRAFREIYEIVEKIQGLFNQPRTRWKDINGLVGCIGELARDAI
jgi:oligoendopeptidase F